MIKIRLQRHGARHAPFYRMVVAPSQARRDGKFIEVLGTYNPQAHKRDEELSLKLERIDHWLGVGAQPTDTAKSLIRQGRMTPEDWMKRSEKLADSKLKRQSKDNADSAPSMDEVEKKEEPSAEEKPVVETMEESKKEEPKAEPVEQEQPKAEDAKAEDTPAEEAAAAAEEAKQEETPEQPAEEDKAQKEEKKDS